MTKPIHMLAGQRGAFRDATRCGRSAQGLDYTTDLARVTCRACARVCRRVAVVAIAETAMLDLAAQLTMAEAQREAAITALKRYGRCDADCTRKDMKGPCSCGFCRFSDEGGLFDSVPRG